jgi:uncharacterized protein YhaN
MTREEACAILGASAGASSEEISNAFRKAARRTHTDSPTGDRAEWDRVVEARDLLLGKDPGSSLVRVDLAQELVRGQNEALERVEQRREQADATQSALQSVTLRHTSSLNRRKRTAWTMGAIAAGLGTLLTIVRTVAISGTDRPEETVIAASLAGAYFVAGVFVLVGFLLQFKAQQLGDAIEDVTAQLSRRANYLELLNEIRGTSHLPAAWLMVDFEQALEEWTDATASHHPTSLASTAREIGARDFGELVIAKGLELGVLSEKTEEDEGEFFVLFGINPDHSAGTER